MKTLGLGNALVDLLVQLESESVIHELNFPKGSMQLIGEDDISSITKRIDTLPVVMVSGGSAANTIHGLSTLGVACGFIGKVGRDDLAKFYNDDLKKAGVNCSLLRSETVTGRAYTLITPDSERTFATYLGAAVEMEPTDLDVDIFSGYDILHVEGYLVQNTRLIEKAMQIAKQNNLKISLDLASFNVVEANLEFLSRIIPLYVDIVFANEEEAKAYTGQAPAEALKKLALQCEIAVVKIGEKGALIQSGTEIINVSAIPANVIDTTGAGDQYAAGFLYGLSENLNLEKCGKLGSLMAGKVIEYYGARIKPEIVDNVLKSAQEIKES